MIICVTGKMAAGKNFISSKFEEQGWISHDADKDVHYAIELAKENILDEFQELAEKKGLVIQNSDGSLNRKELGKLLFSDAKLLKKQENIVYPYVIQLTKDFIQQNKDRNIVLNVTLLYKTPELLSLCSKIVYVKAPLIKRIVRAKKRDHLSYYQILKRFYAQRNLYTNYKKTGIPIEIIKN